MELTKKMIRYLLIKLDKVDSYCRQSFHDELVSRLTEDLIDAEAKRLATKAAYNRASRGAYIQKNQYLFKQFMEAKYDPDLAEELPTNPYVLEQLLIARAEMGKQYVK